MAFVVSMLLAWTGIAGATPAQADDDSLPSVVVEKSVIDPNKEYKKGDIVQFKLAIRCSSLQIHCKLADITDVLNPNLQYVSDSAATGIPVVKSHSGNNLHWVVGKDTDNLDDLAVWFQAGQTFNITINAKVISLPADGSLKIPNKATVAVPGIAPVTSNEVEVKLATPAVAVYDWGLQKVRSDGTANPTVGQEVTYDVRFTRPSSGGAPLNETGIDITSVVLKDIIPDGATFVKATTEAPTSTGVYDAATNTISFPSVAISSEQGSGGMYCGSPCISYFVAHVTVKYEAANGFKAGDVVINKASADPVYKDGSTHPTLTAQAPVTLADAQPSTSTYKANIYGYATPAPGQNIGWDILGNNNGNVVLGEVIVVDDIPNGLDPSTLQINTKHYLMPKSNTPRTATFEYFDGTAWHDLGALGAGATLDLPADAKKVRMTATNVALKEYFGFGLTAKVAADVAPGTVIRNCASTNGDAGLVSDICAQHTVSPRPTANVYPVKSNDASTPSALVPGDEFSWFLRWRTFSIDPIEKATIVENLPAGFELVTEEAPCLDLGAAGGTPGDCAANASTPAYTAEPQPDGTTKITFKDMTLPTFTPYNQDNQGSKEYWLHLKVRVKDGTAAGQYTNKFEVQYPDNDVTCNSTQLTGGKCGAINTVGVINNAAVGIQKWDKGPEPNVLSTSGKASSKCPNWGGYTRYPCVAQTLPNGTFDYRLRIANQGNVSMTKEVVYDILPFVGDKGVSEDLAGKNRATEWRPVLTGPITLDDSLTTAEGHNYKVEYSLSTNPCRPELKSTGGDGDWSGGTCVNDWSTTVANWSDVRAFRISAYADGSEWLPGKMLVLNIPMKAPADANYSTLNPVDLSPAWNSVAQRSYEFADQTNSGRLVSEPPVVGIIIPAPYVSIGDYVWYDDNYNGQQDANEDPAPGVKVTLKDKDGKVVGTTTTDKDGYYWFQNLTEKADYTLEFEKPAGYGWTSKDIGNDKSDSDVDPATSTISFKAPAWESGVSHNLGGAEITDNPTLDGGLVKPIAQVSVGDYVWMDSDNDGIQDASEKGIEGVVLTIKDETGAAVTNVLGQLVGPVTTDANGAYHFGLLPVGHTYTVTIDQAASAAALAGLAPTKANQGSDKAIDSSTGSETSVPMTTDGQHDPTLDFGFYEAPVSIGDFVWYDTNRNGVQDSGEAPYAGMTVKLFKADGVTPAAPDTTTDANGYYFFKNLTSSTDYVVQFVKGSGEVFTAKDSGADDARDSDADPTTGKVKVTTPATGKNLTGAGESDEDDPTIDAGIIKYNLVLEKTLTTTGAIRLGQDVTYTLVPENKGPVDALGGWSVVDLLPEGLTLKSIAGDGYVCTKDSDVKGTCTNAAVLAAGAKGKTITVVATVAEGISGSLKNVAYVDKAANDVPESNPLVVPGLDTDTKTSPTDNDAEAVISLKPLVSIGDYVWYDNNRDGIQNDGAASAYAGMTVELYPATGDMTVATRLAATTTDADGYYFFKDLEASTDYRVKFVKNADESFTAQAQGSDTKVDSNPVVATGVATVKTPATGANLSAATKADDPTIDAGIVKYNLVLAKSLVAGGPYYEGGKATFKLVPKNEGPANELAGWSVTDLIPDGLTIDTMSGAGYTCVVATDKLSGTCTAAAGLAAGESGKEITIVATIGNNIVGKLHNVAYVSPSPQGSVPETNTLVPPTRGVTDTDKTATDNDAQADLEVLPKVSVGDFVWYDTNRDGKQDANEKPAPGVEVNLYDKDGNLVESKLTDKDGYYFFDDLMPGEKYTIEFVKPANTIFTKQDATDVADTDDSDANTSTGKVEFTAPASGLNKTGHGEADNPTIDAGLIKLVSVGDYVWYDTNKNGQQDESELPVAGVTVNLISDGKVIKTTTTDADGFYFFKDLETTAPYTIEFVKPANTVFTVANTGDDKSDSDADPVTGKVDITAPADGHNLTGKGEVDEDDPTIDAGLIKLVSVGDYVWFDVNRDGLQTEGEPVIPDVVVNLYDEAGKLVATTKTDSAGYYAFKDLLAETKYTIEFVKPADTSFTTALSGDVAMDSNADLVTGKYSFTSPKSGSNLTTPKLADDPTIDAGLLKYNLKLTKTRTSEELLYRGETVTFELIPSNDGPVNALAGWSVTDLLPSQLVLVSMSGAGYQCTANVCVSDAPLAAGASGNPITVVAKPGVSFKGKIWNVAYVAPAAGDITETIVLGELPTNLTDTALTATDNDSQDFVRVSPLTAAEAADDGDGDNLAYTGSNGTAAFLGTGLLLLAAGGALTLVRRRRSVS